MAEPISKSKSIALTTDGYMGEQEGIMQSSTRRIDPEMQESFSSISFPVLLFDDLHAVLCSYCSYRTDFKGSRSLPNKATRVETSILLTSLSPATSLVNSIFWLQASLQLVYRLRENKFWLSVSTVQNNVPVLHEI